MNWFDYVLIGIVVILIILPPKWDPAIRLKERLDNAAQIRSLRARVATLTDANELLEAKQRDGFKFRDELLGDIERLNEELDAVTTEKEKLDK